MTLHHHTAQRLAQIAERTGHQPDQRLPELANLRVALDNVLDMVRRSDEIWPRRDQHGHDLPRPTAVDRFIQFGTGIVDHVRQANAYDIAHMLRERADR